VAADDRDDRDNPGARGLASAPALTRVVAVRGVCLTSGPRGVGRGVRRHLRTGGRGPKGSGVPPEGRASSIWRSRANCKAAESEGRNCGVCREGSPSTRPPRTTRRPLVDLLPSSSAAVTVRDGTVRRCQEPFSGARAAVNLDTAWLLQPTHRLPQAPGR
jgi:hypothetical protein